MGNVNQYTPYGATTYQPTGSYTTPDGQTVPTYSQYTELSPTGQSILTGQQDIANNLLPYAGQLAQQAGSAATQPINTNSYYSSLLQNPGAAGNQFNTANSGIANNTAGQIGALNSHQGILSNPGAVNDTNSDLYRAVTQSPGSISGLQTQYDQMLNGGPQLLNQNVTDSVYRQNAAYLDPQFADQKRQLEDQLSRQGIPVGSEAYNRATDQFSRGQERAYQSARDAAVSQGVGASSQLFGNALAGRQQNLGQTEAAAQQALSAQGLTSNMANTAYQAALAGRGQDLSQLQAQQQAALAGQQQYLGQQNQGFNQALSGQQQYLGQQQMQQQQPLALLQALLGAAPATPSQPMVTPVPAQVGQTDVIGATGLASNAANSAYQAQTAQNNAMWGGLGSLGTAGALLL